MFPLMTDQPERVAKQICQWESREFGDFKRLAVCCPWRAGRDFLKFSIQAFKSGDQLMSRGENAFLFDAAAAHCVPPPPHKKVDLVENSIWFLKRADIQYYWEQVTTPKKGPAYPFFFFFTFLCRISCLHYSAFISPLRFSNTTPLPPSRPPPFTFPPQNKITWITIIAQYSSC